MLAGRPALAAAQIAFAARGAAASRRAMAALAGLEGGDAVAAAERLARELDLVPLVATARALLRRARVCRGSRAGPEGLIDPGALWLLGEARRPRTVRLAPRARPRVRALRGRPLAAALVPVSRALSARSPPSTPRGSTARPAPSTASSSRLSREQAARPSTSSRAARRQRRSPAILGSGAISPADAAARAREWMDARGLDVLAVAEPDGRSLSSGHLPGRAGDVDAEVAALLATRARSRRRRAS